MAKNQRKHHQKKALPEGFLLGWGYWDLSSWIRHVPNRLEHVSKPRQDVMRQPRIALYTYMIPKHIYIKVWQKIRENTIRKGLLMKAFF